MLKMRLEIQFDHKSLISLLLLINYRSILIDTKLKRKKKANISFILNTN